MLGIHPVIHVAYLITWIACHKDCPSRVLAHQLIWDQKVKGQGHKVTKCKNKLKVVSYRRELYTLSSARSLVTEFNRSSQSIGVYLTLISRPSSTRYLSWKASHAARPPPRDVTFVTSRGSSDVTPAINSSVKSRCPRTKSSPVISPSRSVSSWPNAQTICPAVRPTSRSWQRRRKSADVRNPRFFTSIERKISIVYVRRMPQPTSRARARSRDHIASGRTIFDEISTLGWRKYGLLTEILHVIRIETAQDRISSLVFLGDQVTNDFSPSSALVFTRNSRNITLPRTRTQLVKFSYMSQRNFDACLSIPTIMYH